MAEFPETFEPDQVPQDERSFDLLPQGDYHVQVIDSKIEETKSGSGQMLVLTLEVLDGPYQNRKLWDRLNIRNQNPDAQRISQRSLADLCIAVGVTALKNSEELHFKPLTVRVGIRKDKSGQYPDQNTVRYKKTAQAGNGKPTPQAAAQKPAAPAAASKPWKK